MQVVPEPTYEPKLSDAGKALLRSLFDTHDHESWLAVVSTPSATEALDAEPSLVPIVAANQATLMMGRGETNSIYAAAVRCMKELGRKVVPSESPDVFADVMAFHEKLCPHLVGRDGPTWPTDKPFALRLGLVKEEIGELEEAAVFRDLPGVADAIGDAIYVLAGMAVTLGIDMAPIWNAIHRANMAKEGGPTRDDGKILKPEGWNPPDVAGLLRAQAARATA